MLARGALAAGAYRLLQPIAVDVDVAADGHVVDRDAGILAQQVGVVLGDADVPDHGAEYRLRGGVGFLLRQRGDTRFDVGREDFKRADIELLRRFLYLFQINVHEGFLIHRNLALSYHSGP